MRRGAGVRHGYHFLPGTLLAEARFWPLGIVAELLSLVYGVGGQTTACGMLYLNRRKA